MSKWTIAAVAAVLILLVGNMARYTEKAQGAADLLTKSLELSEDECVKRYVVTAAAEFGVRAARIMCSEIHDPATTAERQKVIECVLPLLADARNELAVKVAISRCNGKFMPPPAPASLDSSARGTNYFDRPELKRNYFDDSSEAKGNPYDNPYSSDELPASGTTN